MINKRQELKITKCPSHFFLLKILIKYLKDTLEAIGSVISQVIYSQGSRFTAGKTGGHIEMER